MAQIDGEHWTVPKSGWRKYAHTPGSLVLCVQSPSSLQNGALKCLQA